MGVIKKGWTDIELDKLVEATWNYKQENEDLMEKLKENIKRNGMIENIIVRELETGFFEVINGNHRLIILKELDWKNPVHVFNCGKIDIHQAIRISIETNESKFISDNVKLAERLKEITETTYKDITELSKTMPFSEEQIKNMIGLLKFDFDQYEDMGKATEPKKVVCPSCGFEFEL
jgi:ParB-like chromosome segregation protein Spo0J